jgi:hypothetical protein
MTLVRAPAGWGKSTLLADWQAAASEPRPFAWLALDEQDNDPVRFWTYAIESLRTVVPEIGESSLALTRTPGLNLTDVMLPVLVNELAASQVDVVFVLDDYHLITYLAVLAVLHFLPTDVDPATDPVSDYAVGDYGTLSVLATLGVGLGALALTAALHQTGRRSMVGLVLLAVFGLAKVVQPFFPIDVGDETTASGIIHNVFGNVAFFALPVGAVLLSRSRGRFELVVAVPLVVAMLGVFVSDAVGGFGIAQRVFLVLSSIWVRVTAVGCRASR